MFSVSSSSVSVVNGAGPQLWVVAYVVSATRLAFSSQSSVAKLDRPRRTCTPVRFCSFHAPGSRERGEGVGELAHVRDLALLASPQLAGQLALLTDGGGACSGDRGKLGPLGALELHALFHGGGGSGGATPHVVGVARRRAACHARLHAAEEHKLTLAGCSLGAGVAMRIARSRPELIARLTLITPPGLPERCFMPAHTVREAARLLCDALPGYAKQLHLLRVILTTPEYGCDVSGVARLAADGAFRLRVYAAGLDVVHTPHVAFWRAAEANGGVKYTYLPGRTHWGVCTSLWALRSIWRTPFGRVAVARIRRGAAEIRARL